MSCPHSSGDTCLRCRQFQLEARQQSLEGTVGQWTEARKTLSRRVNLAEQTADQHGDLLMTMQGQISDLQERAVFAQRRTADTRTLVVRLPVDQVKTAIVAIAGTVDTYAIEILE